MKNPQKTPKNLYFALVFLSIVFFASCENEDTILPLSNLITYDTNISTLYKFNMTETQSSVILYLPSNLASDLSLQLKPLETSSVPDVAVYLNNEDVIHRKPFNYFTPDQGCVLLTLPLRVLKGKDTISIKFNCSEETCLFSFRTDLTPTVEMTAASPKILSFDKSPEQIVRIFVENEPSTTLSHLVISAELVNISQASATFYCYINAGNEIPSSGSHDFKTETLWLNSKGAIVFADEKKFCTNCNYTLLIQADETSNVQVSVRKYTNINEFSLGDRKYDALTKDRSVTYSFDLVANKLSDQDELDILFTPYSGFGRVRIAAENVPKSDFDYKLEFSEFGVEHIKLRHMEREALGIRTKLYITITAKYGSLAFLLRVRRNHVQINFGEIDVGVLRLGEQVNYVLNSSNIESLDKDITFTLYPESGRVDLFVKQCQKPFDRCEISKEEVKEFYQGTKSVSKVFPQFLGSLGDKRLKEITIKQDEDECYGAVPSELRNERYCLYAIAAVGKSLETNVNSRYRLIVKRNSTIVPLSEGHPIRDYVEHQEHKYYSFSLSSSASDVESVVFQVTPLTGAVLLFASKYSHYPNGYSEYKASPHGKITINKNEGTSLDGVYYISVYGTTYSSYILAAIVNRKSTKHDNGKNPSRTVVELTSGFSQKDTLQYGEIGYYRFKLDLPNTFRGHLDINLRPIKGRFAMYVRNDGILPSNTSYMWASRDDAQLRINSTDRNFEKSGKYLVAVYPLAYSNQKPLDQYSYVINFVPSTEVMTLESGVGFSGYVSKSRPKYFKFEYGYEDGDVLITKAGDKNKVDLFISFEQSNQFPSAARYNISTHGEDKAILKISKETLNKVCHFEDEIETNECKVFMAATTNETQSIRLFITITKENQINELIDGRYGYYPIFFDRPLRFYFLPQATDKTVTIISDSKTHPVTLYANIGSELGNYPTRSAYNFSSKELKRGFHSDHLSEITIREKDLNQCQGGYYEGSCVVSIAIFPDSKLPVSSDIDFPVFSLVASSEIQMLNEGVPILGYVEAHSVKYYNLHVTESNITLHISVTPLSEARVVLTLAYGAHSRPTLEKGTYLFRTHQGQTHLEVSLEDLQKLVPEQSSMNGEWVLGVHAWRPARFQLLFLYESFKIFELSSRLPFDFKLTNQTKYFKYFNRYNNRDLIFRLTKEYGTTRVYIKAYQNENEVFGSNPPSKNSSTWSFSGSNKRGEVTIKVGDEEFCRRCYYVIAVVAEDSASSSLLAMHRGDQIILRDGKPMSEQLSQKESAGYSFMKVSPREAIDISLITTSGAVNISVFSSSNMSESSRLAVPQLTFGSHTKIRISPDEDEVNNVQEESEVYEKEYYLQVRAIKDAAYTIVASSSNTITTLYDGFTQYSILQPGESNSYRYEIPEEVFELADQTNTTPSYRMKFALNVYNSYLELFEEIEPDKDYQRYTLFPNISIALVETFAGEGEYVDPSSLAVNQSNALVIRSQIAPYKQYKTYNGIKSEISATQLLFIHPELHMQQQVGKKRLKAHLEILVNNTNTLPVQFSFVARTKDVILLSLGQEHLSKVVIEGEELYEVYVPRKGILAVEIRECYGVLSFEIADSLEKVQNGLWDVEVKKPSKSFAVGTVQATPQTYYIKVKAVDGLRDEGESNDKYALYKFQTRLYQLNDPLPYDKFFFPRSGNFHYEMILQDSIVKFFWGDVQSLETKELRRNYDMEFTYKLIVTSDQVLAGVISKCGIIPDNDSKHLLVNSSYHRVVHLERNRSKDAGDDETTGRSYKIGDRNEYDVTIDALTQQNENDTYYTALVATGTGKKIGSTEIVWEVSVYYDILEIFYPKRVAGVGALVVVMAFAAVLAFLGLVYVVIKYRKTQQRLAFELGEVRTLHGLKNNMEVELTADTRLDEELGEGPDAPSSYGKIGGK